MPATITKIKSLKQKQLHTTYLRENVDKNLIII